MIANAKALAALAVVMASASTPPLADVLSYCVVLTPNGASRCIERTPAQLSWTLGKARSNAVCAPPQDIPTETPVGFIMYCEQAEGTIALACFTESRWCGVFRKAFSARQNERSGRPKL